MTEEEKREKRNKYAREWRAKNPEAARAATRRYAEKNPEAAKDRYNKRRQDPIFVESERARSRAFSPRYRPVKTAKAKKWREDLRRETFAAYGNVCSCCGESNWKFLTLDHVFGDGAEQRRKLSGTNGRPRGGVWEYAHIRKLGYPKDRYQLLCWNCNCGRARNGGICPHKEVDLSIELR